MITLNLLSAEKKKSVKRLITYFMVKNISSLVISLLLIASTVFGFSYLLLNNFSESLEEQIEKERTLQKEERIVSIEEATKELNDQLKSAKKIQSDYIPWTDFLSSFDDEVIQGITLSNVEFSMTTKSFKLIGVANLRSTLLAFQNELETLPELTDITSPISNLSQPENIQFEITGAITDEIY